MSKWKAFTLSIVCGIATIGSLIQQAYMPSLAFGIGFFLFCSIFLYKSERDLNIISQARQQKVETPKVSAIPMTSKGSSRLFVPPPIND